MGQAVRMSELVLPHSRCSVNTRCVNKRSKHVRKVGSACRCWQPWEAASEARRVARLYPCPATPVPRALLLMKSCSSREWMLVRWPARRRQSLSASSHARRWAK